MEGILGVGVAEVILIGLVLFIIGGPENTAKWARELGRWVRKGREALSEAMAQLETEMGDEGKEIVDAAREVGQEFREVRRMTSPRGWMESSVTLDDPKPKAPLAKDAQPQPIDAPEDTTDAGEEQPADQPDKNKVYTAWVPPEN